MVKINTLVASTLRQLASALALEHESKFKIKAYRRAAQTIDHLDRDVGQMLARGEPLTSLPGVGQGISRTIEEIIRTGHLTTLDRRLQNQSAELQELLTYPKLDAKKVLRVYKKLGLHSLTELRQAIESGRLDELDRRTAFHIRQALSSEHQVLLWDADQTATHLIAFLKTISTVENVSVAGALRRRRENIDGLDFLVQTNQPADVFRRVDDFGGLVRVKSSSRNTAVYQSSTGVRVAVAAAKYPKWGTALIQATGSEDHLRQLMERTTAKRVTLPPCEEEEQVYVQLGLPWIAPELREGQGEIEAAEQQSLPQLVELKDLRGDLHMHTTASDGANTLEQMADAASQRGYSYIAITDHSQSLKIAKGLNDRQLMAQIKAIDRFNEQQSKIRVLKSAEVDILADGSLDYSDVVLKELDFTICSIHSRFSLNKRQQTDRLLRAMDHPFFTILGHATGRLILKREGYEIDIDKVLDHAVSNECFVEINSSPDRLDLSDEHARLAKERGIKVAINTDAHNIRELGFVTAGLNQARRAWLEPKDVLNTRKLADLLKLLRQRRS